jgi:hypothetical protein
MNEHIENLMYQAGLTAQGCWDEMDEYDRTAILKFAELIVKECADIATINAHQYQPPGDFVLKHFGVK